MFLYDFYHKSLSGTLLVYPRRMKTGVNLPTKVIKCDTVSKSNVHLYVIVDQPMCNFFTWHGLLIAGIHARSIVHSIQKKV